MDVVIKNRGRPVCDVQRYTHSAHDNQKHECRLCGLKYVYAHTLRNHIASVHEAKRFRCGVCDHVFSYASSLCRHLTKNHPGGRAVISKNTDEAVISPTEDIPREMSPKVPTSPTGVIEQLPPALNIDDSVRPPTPEDIPIGVSRDFSVSPTTLVVEQTLPATNIDDSLISPTPEDIPDGVLPDFPMVPISVTEQLPPALNIDDSVRPPTPEEIQNGVSPEVPTIPVSMLDQILPATNINDSVISPTEDIPLEMSPKVPTSPTGVIEQLPPVINIKAELIAPTPEDSQNDVSPDVTTSPTGVIDQILPESSGAPSRKHTRYGSKTKRVSDVATIQPLPSAVKKQFPEIITNFLPMTTVSPVSTLLTETESSLSRKRTGSPFENEPKKKHVKDSYNCDLCRKIYSRLSDMQRHKINVHLKQRYACDICSLSFTLLKILLRHTENDHQPLQPYVPPTSS